MPTLKGLRRWLHTLRDLNRLQDIATQDARAVEELGRRLAQGERQNAELAAQVSRLAIDVQRVQQEESNVRDGVRAELTGLSARLDGIERQQRDEAAARSGVRSEIVGLTARLDDAIASVRERFDRIEPGFPAVGRLGSADAAAWFHSSIEATFRGPYDEIRERLRIYLPYVDALPPALRDLAAVDIGCGRGEWIELLGEHGVRALGIDENRVSIDRCAERGLHAMCGDGVAYLRQQPDGQLSIVSAFHVVEHLHPAIVMALLLEARRVLAPCGLLILETPNPENLRVAGYAFHFDPTHRHPIPAPLLRTFVEFAQFEVVDELALQPDVAMADVASREQWPPTLVRMLAGARDSALIARKPIE